MVMVPGELPGLTTAPLTTEALMVPLPEGVPPVSELPASRLDYVSSVLFTQTKTAFLTCGTIVAPMAAAMA